MTRQDFLKQLEPYNRHLDNYEVVKTITDKEVLNKVVAIWDIFKNEPEISKVIYGSVKIMPKTNMGCEICISEAVRSTIAWRRSIRNDIPKYEFKGVPQTKAKVTEVEIPSKENDIAFYKTHLNAAGVSYHHKAGLNKLRELYEKLKHGDN